MSKTLKQRQMIEAEKENSRLRLAHHSKSENEAPKYKSLDEELYECVFHGFIKTGINGFTGKSRNDHRRALEMARFLFGPYKVPKILNGAWLPVELDAHKRAQKQQRDLRIVNTTHILVPGGQAEFRSWYITIATGGSFFKEHCKDFLTRKEAHTFLECPHEIGVVAALKYAIAINAGASVGIALRLSNSKLTLGHVKLDRWRDVIRFLVRETPASVDECNDIIDWVDSKFADDNKFRLSGHGYTIDSVRKKIKDWHYALRRLKVLGNHSWTGHAIETFKYEAHSIFQRGKIDVWTINQILTTKELAAEGTEQRHCVYSYRIRCQKGECSIWSLKMNNNRKVTIELLNDGTIAQARGIANRVITAEEANVIRRWAAANNLYMRKY